MRIAIRNARIAFPQIFEPDTVNGEGAPAYSVALIIPKDHPQVSEMNDLVEAVAREKWDKLAAATLKQMRLSDKICLHDGDLKASYEGFEGNFYISARNTMRPLVVARDKTPLTAADGVIYSGCYCNVFLELWAQDNAYGKRVNATLMGVQFVKDGEAFSSAGKAMSMDEFDDLSVEDTADLS